ncbi:glycoside hydrolase [Nadsonia fulvescens var. elongata DSM 6958]|uniref:Glycoside hydrolase n=1 Tax=Nadsonia fulvescens var. elongata DSM 6958 TaxID=857566 RepID=A0A1E3PEP1_9ASCO|nr:glycoside hydrolase [Nadsonia fulvescens var. elongata DSM 6958]
MGLFHKIKDKLEHSSASTAAAPAATTGQPPSTRQIYHSRFNHGPNLGSLFVLEKWISDDCFPENSPDMSELDAAKAAFKAQGVAASELWKNHYTNFIGDNDFKWLRDQGVNAVRVPIGYWVVDNGNFTSGTPFDEVKALYAQAGAWDHFKNLISMASQYGIGVLCDLHGLPGGANGDKHSGTSSGKAEFWGSKKYQGLTLDILSFIANDLKGYDNLVGIQIINEAPYESHLSKQQSFYLEALAAIRSKNADIPVYISDGWNLEAWVKWVQDEDNKLGPGESTGFVIDTHTYRCFSDSDHGKRAQDLIAEIQHSSPFNGHNWDARNVDVIVGEYSCVIDGSSWEKQGSACKDDNHPVRRDLVRQYGQCQDQTFGQFARAGNYFWTYKFKWNGGEWDFREMIDRGGLIRYSTIINDVVNDRNRLDQEFSNRCNQRLSDHSNYWESQAKGKKFEHARYQKGFVMGWNDALQFYQYNCSKIGRMNAWKRARLGQHIQEDGNSEFTWEWTQGFEKGVEEFANFVN